MRVSRARLLAAVASAVLIGTGVRVLADDGPLAELERALHALEDTVRSIHQERLDAQRETEKARVAAAQLDAEARDLEREAVALEDEAQPLGPQVAALEKERDAARARNARLMADRASLEKALTGGGERGTAPAGVSLSERVKGLEARRELARSSSVEADGSVRVGTSARVAAGSAAARALAEQLSRSAPPVFVRAPIEVGSK
jgi:phage shock protein A